MTVTREAIVRTFVPLIVLLGAAMPAAAGLTCRAEVDRTAVAAGQRLVLTLSVEGQTQQQPRHDPPRVEGVRVVPGGTSQRFSLDADGTRMAVTATYYLEVERADDFTIPAVVFTVGSERCQTAPIRITVSPSAPQAPPPAATTPGAPAVAPTAAGPRAGRPGDPEYITMTVDADQVWLGQQIILTFRYHRLRQGTGRPSYTPPRTEGFWRIDLPPERNYRMTHAGAPYDVTEIRYALFPTRAGALTIESARLELASDPFDRFFGRRPRGPQVLATEPITIDVRDLPSPRPNDFSGIVAGSLALTARVSRDTIPRGEPLSLAVEVAADAFLKSFAGLTVPSQDGLRVHPAGENLREDPSGQRFQATLRQELAVVPTREGEVALPPVTLTYFDTGAGAYRTVRARTSALIVTPSDLPVAGDDPSGFRRTEIARLGHDLAFVHTASGSLRRQAPPLLHRPLWWAAALVPWVLLGGYRWRLRRQEVAARDPLGQRQRQAWPRAQKILSGLAANGGEAGELARTITGYVADRTGRAAAAVTAADVRVWCDARGHAAAGGRLASILEACDHARFGGAATLDVPALAREARDLLAAIQRASDRPKAGLAARSLILILGAAVAAAPAAAIGPAPAPGVDPARLLAEGNQAYTEGDLEAALDRYRQALTAGADDAVLHYNLGNTHARRGELGRAIASYLRAQRLAPRDRDLRTNLAWVRSHTRDLELAGGALPPLVAQLDAAAHLLSLDEWAALLVLLSGLTALATAWTWRRGWTTAAWRRWRLALAGALALVLVVTATRWYAEVRRDLAVVIGPEVAVRSGPATTFSEVFRVHDGLVLEIRGERDGWARIGLGGDWVGWLPAGYLERVARR